ncbi:MAG TPA: LacI family DNA-binding transcriptional regulator [Anaerolineales bacterium]|nr:LacI family DNA-binding transcriptional regulator [Anaerolineales bacterium]
MATIREVAESARVSYATVSHVINNTRLVSQETRERVLEAMAALNYRPNALARSLRQGKSNTIGLVLPDSANPFFAEISRSIEDEAFKKGYSVFLCNTELDTQRELLYVDVLSKNQVDGIIFVATGDQADSLDFLLRQNMPVVMIDRDVPNVEVDAVLTDNQLGGFLATHHLIELGHKHIACIAGPSSITPSAERIIGYRRALEQGGISYDENMVLRGDYHAQSGMEMTHSILKMNPRPTAIFALNDLMALGALRAAAEAGYTVPRDLAVVGYDNLELARFTNPPLTTISQPKKEIGAQAVNLLVDRISQKSRPPSRLVLAPELIIRRSTKEVDQFMASAAPGLNPAVQAAVDTPH